MIDTASYSSKGGRQENEDTAQVLEYDGALCAVVADGLGGHGGGRTASRTAVRCITEDFRISPWPDEQQIHQMFVRANDQILKQQTMSCRMKTTCAALFLKEGEAVWAHMGDTRLYHFVDGRLVSQTRDHSVSQMAVLSGEIKKEQIRFHVDRNRVLRALGTKGDIRPELSGVTLLRGGFHTFLLCTDGFWEYMLEDEMEIELVKAETAGELVENLCFRLEENVKKQGKQQQNDNYTICAVFYEADGREDGGLGTREEVAVDMQTVEMRKSL